VRIVDIRLEIDAASERYFQLVPDHPLHRGPFRQLRYHARAHSRSRSPDHPAVLCACFDLADGLARTLTGDDVLPALFFKISQRKIGADVAGPNIRPRIDEGEIAA